jgi:hypothetical protein
MTVLMVPLLQRCCRYGLSNNTELHSSRWIKLYYLNVINTISVYSRQLATWPEETSRYEALQI